jgi:hypothetical protein
MKILNKIKINNIRKKNKKKEKKNLLKKIKDKLKITSNF